MNIDDIFEVLLGDCSSECVVCRSPVPTGDTNDLASPCCEPCIGEFETDPDNFQRRRQIRLELQMILQQSQRA